ncbi:unnamed protein product, partial [marine sediment metagenome]
WWGFDWSAGMGHSLFALNASDKKTSYRFTAPLSKTVNSLWIYDNDAAGTSPIYRVGLQGDNNGLPDGSWLNGNAYYDQQFVGNWHESDIPNTALTADTIYHIVVEYASGTINGSNYGTVYQKTLGSGKWTNTIPYDPRNLRDDAWMVHQDTGSGWFEQLSRMVQFLVEWDDGTTYGQPYSSTYGNQPDRYPIYGTQYTGVQFVLDKNYEFSSVKFKGLWDGVGTPSALYLSIYDVTNSTYIIQDQLWDEAISDVVQSQQTHELDSQISLYAGITYQMWLES